LRGRKRTKKKGDEKMTSKSKIQKSFIGRILLALAIPIFIVNIVLLNRPNPDLRITGILIIVSNCLFIPGLILSLLSHQNDKNKEEKRK